MPTHPHTHSLCCVCVHTTHLHMYLRACDLCEMNFPVSALITMKQRSCSKPRGVKTALFIEKPAVVGECDVGGCDEDMLCTVHSSHMFVIQCDTNTRGMINIPLHPLIGYTTSSSITASRVLLLLLCLRVDKHRVDPIDIRKQITPVRELPTV